MMHSELRLDKQYADSIFLETQSLRQWQGLMAPIAGIKELVQLSNQRAPIREIELLAGHLHERVEGKLVPKTTYTSEACIVESQEVSDPQVQMKAIKYTKRRRGLPDWRPTESQEEDDGIKVPDLALTQDREQKHGRQQLARSAEDEAELAQEPRGARKQG